MIKLSLALCNARLEAAFEAIGPSPTSTLRTGPPPVNCAAANSGVVLATIPLPTPWMAPAANGEKTLASGPWQDTNADASGLVEHFRIHDLDGVCHMQGTVGVGTGDIWIDNAALVAGQTVGIAAFTMSDDNHI